MLVSIIVVSRVSRVCSKVVDRLTSISEMDQLDIYWDDISAVFGLTKLFGPPLKHQDAEVPTHVSEETSNFLQNDIKMAEFVEDFVMDSYNIILREDIVPKFWDHFQEQEEGEEDCTG